MSNVNRILKLANLYVKAVSQTFDILDTKRSVQSICDMVKAFVSKNKLSDAEHRQFNFKVAKMALIKFNKLIVPYLNMNEVNIPDISERIFKGGNQDELNFFLHDLIHEVLSPGSISKFKEIDEEIAKSRSSLNEEDEEDEDEEEDREEVIPPYQLGGANYSLEDYIEEQVAETLTDPNKVAKNGLLKYIQLLIIGTANSLFDTDWSENESEFFLEIDRDDLVAFFEEINQQITEDIADIKKDKYTQLANKYFHSFKNWQAEILAKSFPKGHESIPVYKAEEGKGDPKYGDIYISDSIRSLLNKTSNWIASNFNLIVKDYRGEKLPLEMGEKPTSDLTNDFKMSLLRRWLLSVEKNTSIMLGKEPEQLSFNF